MKEQILKSWNNFLELAESLDIGLVSSKAYVFRGQADAKWPLQPSLLRILVEIGANEEQALSLEKNALALFRAQSHSYIATNEFYKTTDDVSWFTLMQHHGAPTRLLDWSGSIFVAAYFAAQSHMKDNGAIWIAHLDSLQSVMKQQYGDGATIPSTQRVIQENYFQPGAPRSVSFLKRLTESDRMISQQGGFSICRNILGDHGQIMAEALPDDDRWRFGKLILPGEQKLIFLKKLRSMNIAANSLFPGLDGTARSVGELVRLGLT